MNMEDDNEVSSFKELGVCEQLVEACDNLGWKTPSKIQALVLPHALEGVPFEFSATRFCIGRCLFYWIIISGLLAFFTLVFDCFIYKLSYRLSFNTL